jgi:hypothetical protein
LLAVCASVLVGVLHFESIFWEEPAAVLVLKKDDWYRRMVLAEHAVRALQDGSRTLPPLVAAQLRALPAVCMNAAFRAAPEDPLRVWGGLHPADDAALVKWFATDTAALAPSLEELKLQLDVVVLSPAGPRGGAHALPAVLDSQSLAGPFTVWQGHASAIVDARTVPPGQSWAAAVDAVAFDQVLLVMTEAAGPPKEAVRALLERSAKQAPTVVVGPWASALVDSAEAFDEDQHRHRGAGVAPWPWPLDCDSLDALCGRFHSSEKMLEAGQSAGRAWRSPCLRLVLVDVQLDSSPASVGLLVLCAAAAASGRVLPLGNPLLSGASLAHSLPAVGSAVMQYSVDGHGHPVASTIHHGMFAAMASFHNGWTCDGCGSSQPAERWYVPCGVPPARVHVCAWVCERGYMWVCACDHVRDIM